MEPRPWHWIAHLSRPIEQSSMQVSAGQDSSLDSGCWKELLSITLVERPRGCTVVVAARCRTENHATRPSKDSMLVRGDIKRRMPRDHTVLHAVALLAWWRLCAASLTCRAKQASTGSSRWPLDCR